MAKNVPSDGSERAVANGLPMISVQPVEQSTRFATGEQAVTPNSVAMRVGPGNNYAILEFTGFDTVGDVLNHALQRVRASGTNWRWCEFDGKTGWVPDDFMLPVGCAGDCSGDGRVNADDLPLFEFCFFGPDVTDTSGHFCLDGDGDGDLDIDTADFAVMQRCAEEP